MKEKKRTPNAQRRTLNAGAMKNKSKRSTPNAQRRTSNADVMKSSSKRSASNVKWSGNGLRVAESAGRDYGDRREYDLEDRLLEFAANIVRLVESLPSTRAGNHIAGQLLRCGTSPLSNHGEVEAAESRKDFLHKLRICLKELRETKRWLRLVGLLKLAEVPDFIRCLNEVEELIRIFVASVRTAQRNAK
jgi:four helix bundle protein